MAPPDLRNEPEDPDGEALWIDRHLLPAIRNPGLLPVLLVIGGHIVAFVAPALVFALRDRSVPALLGVVLMAVLSAECVRFEWRHGRRPTLSKIVVSIWAVAVATAFAVNHYGVM